MGSYGLVRVWSLLIHSGFQKRRVFLGVPGKEKALNNQGFNGLSYGGGGRNRTGVDGFASRCITILLLRHGYLNKGCFLYS